MGSRAAATSSAEQEVSLGAIALKLERLRWRHAIWGVSERQAWHVIGRLCEMYEQLLREQELRYEALLAEARSQAQAQPPVARTTPQAGWAASSAASPAAQAVPLVRTAPAAALHATGPGSAPAPERPRGKHVRVSS